MSEFNHEDFLKNLPVHSGEIGFKPDEMIECASCARKNAPNRAKCFYCGATLDISAEQAAKFAPALRKLENWENGFNLIMLPTAENFEAGKISEIGKAIGNNDLTNLSAVAEAGKPLPLARVESEREAEILRNRLKNVNIGTAVVSDEQLDAENPPKRLRGLEFHDDKLLLIFFNNDEIEEIGADELGLIVSGAIFQKSVESTEKRKKGETKIIEETETASDEILIDIYKKNDAGGYRILTKGFDFSSLGAEKEILARQNIRKLAAEIQKRAPQVKFVDDYLIVRIFLGEVWKPEERRDSKGLTRQRFGKFDLSNISSSSNLQQFTKYSRLQWHLL